MYSFVQIFVDSSKANIFRHSFETFFLLMNIFRHSLGMLDSNEYIGLKMLN